MKKFLCILAVLLIFLLILPIFSYANGFDLSSLSNYSLDELLELRNAISEEIKTRMSEPSSALYNGRYYVGIDIKPGKYLLSVHSLSNGIQCSSIVARSGNEKEDYGMPAGMSVIIDLSEGTTLEVRGVLSATLTDVPPASYAP